MFRRSIVFGAVAAALAATTAYAEPVTFDAVDTDGDRIITRAEWNRAANAGQAASGAASPDLVVVTITPVQAQAMNEQRRESLFRALDSNGDGNISQAEAGLNTDLMKAFARVDRNNDGKLDRQEFVRVHVNEGAQQQSQAGGAQQSEPKSAASGGSQLPSREIEERSRFGAPFRGESGSGGASGAGGSSSDSGGMAVKPAPIPSSRIEERSRFSAPKER